MVRLRKNAGLEYWVQLL